MTAMVFLLIGLGIGWWANKARFWYGEVTSTRAKVGRYRKERNRTMAMTAVLIAVLAITIIGIVQGR